MITVRTKNGITHMFTEEQLTGNKEFADAFNNLRTMKLTWNPKTWLRYFLEYRKAIRACRK